MKDSSEVTIPDHVSQRVPIWALVILGLVTATIVSYNCGVWDECAGIGGIDFGVSVW